MNYKDITREQAKELYNNNIELVCDGDKQKLACEELTEAILAEICNVFNILADSFKLIASKIADNIPPHF